MKRKRVEMKTQSVDPGREGEAEQHPRSSRGVRKKVQDGLSKTSLEY